MLNFGMNNLEMEMMMQQMMRQYRSPMFSPYFTGGGAATAPQAAQSNYVMSAVTPPVSNSKLIKQQAQQVDALLNEAFAARAELDKYVDIKELDGQPVLKEQYDAKSGYIAVDGKNDGKIGGWDKLKNFGKGILNLFTDMVCDKNGKPSVKKIATTVIVGGVLATIGLLFPPAGAAMLAVGGVMAAGTLGVGAYKAATAKTDEQAEKAWQNVGSGTAQLVLTLVGAKGMGNVAATKAGVVAPKWYRPDQSIALSMKEGHKAAMAAGGYQKYAGNAFAELWNAAKMKVFSVDKSYYSEKYNNQIQTLDDQIASTADRRYKHILEYTKKCYEGVRNAADDEALRVANAKMEGASKLLQRYINDNAGSTSDDALVAVKEMLEISKSCAAKNARAMSASTSIGDAAATSKTLADDIANLEATNPVAGSPEAYKLRILKTLENRYKALYNAKTPEEQTRILNSINRINDAVVNKTYKVSTTTGTTDDVMRAYNQIATTTEEYVNGAEIVLQARKVDLLNAKAILENKTQHTKTEIQLAKDLIKRFKSNVSTDKQYIEAVDQLTASSGRMSSVKNWFSTKKQNTKAKAGSFWKNTAKLATRPETIVTGSVINMFSAKTGATGFYGTEIKSGTERLQQLAEIDNYITQLRYAQNELNNGRLVDIQM